MIGSSSEHILAAKDLAGGYHGKSVIRGFDLSVKSGSAVCILGPNGVGKTTMLRTLLGTLPPLAGSVTVDGKDYRLMSQRERARHISYVPQAHASPFAFRVIDVVSLGRIASMGILSSPGKEDIREADRILSELGIDNLRERTFTELSGGERQMVMIARALVQRSEFMILDEPTSSLDYGNQVRVLKTLKHLRLSGYGIIMTTHFPNHAFWCDAQVILMNRNGRILSGQAADIITERNMIEAYNARVRIFEVEDGGKTIKICEPVM